MISQASLLVRIGLCVVCVLPAVWRQLYTFVLFDPTCVMRLKVWDWDNNPSEPDDFIGQVCVPLQPFIDLGAVSVNARLHPASRTSDFVLTSGANAGARGRCPFCAVQDLTHSVPLQTNSCLLTGGLTQLCLPTACRRP